MPQAIYTVNDLVSLSDADVQTTCMGELDGFWRDAVKLRTSDLKANIGPMSFRAGFLLTPQWWRCPACMRNKIEIMRKTNDGTIHCRLVHHHDHIADILNEKGVPFGFRRRFQTVVLCEGCNLADAKAKKIVTAPRWFSFDPFDIRRFIKCNDDGSVDICKYSVEDIWGTRKMKAFVNLVEVICRHLGDCPLPDPWGNGPNYYTPFCRNSKMIEGEPYVQDGYHQSFRDAIYRIGFTINDVASDFATFAARSRGTTRG